MGESSGAACSPSGRASPLWVRIWCNRTKALGYAGAAVGALYMALEAGQHWQLAMLGALVAALGHYNDRHVGQ